MIKDLMLAALVTLVCGTAVLQGWAVIESYDIVAMVGVILSIAVGPLFLWLRGRRPIIPIASIYCVVMFLVLVFVDFLIAWHQGRVDL